MLTVGELLKYARVFKSKLFQNAENVSIGFVPVKEGQDKYGYFRSIKGNALTQEPDKKLKTFEIRVYYSNTLGGLSEKKKYIPPKFRKPDYKGPAKPPKLTRDSLCWVQCSCEWFLYAVEVADTRHDSSEIRYSNGQWYQPHGPNPNGVPHCCKHLISALRNGALLRT
jgi:hypothetical protein